MTRIKISRMSSSLIQTLLSVLESHQINSTHIQKVCVSTTPKTVLKSQVSKGCGKLADFTAGREFHPAPKTFFIFFLSIIPPYCIIFKNNFYCLLHTINHFLLFTPYPSPAFNYCRPLMVSWIRLRATSTLMTLTSTTSPTLTTSRGCLTNFLSVSWEM